MSRRTDLRLLCCLAALSLAGLPGCDDPADEAALIAADQAAEAEADVPLAAADEVAPVHRCGAHFMAGAAIAGEPASGAVDGGPAGEAVALPLADAREDDAVAATPLFQMPFFVGQKWRASTYDGHYPNQNSIDLMNLTTSSLGQVVVASAAGTVKDVGPVLSPEGDYYGDYVNIDHGDGWETRYLHIVKSGSIAKGTTVVRGQRLGTVGQYHDMGVHLHYTQLKDGAAVRITFNGAPIGVHMGAPKTNGVYPTQDLVSVNTPTGISVTPSSKGGSARSSAGAGVRAAAECMNTKQLETVVYGSRVPAGETSTATCPTGWWATDLWSDF